VTGRDLELDLRLPIPHNGQLSHVRIDSIDEIDHSVSWLTEAQAPQQRV
jgi:hypothetical protein